MGDTRKLNMRMIQILQWEMNAERSSSIQRERMMMR